jgi:hypothetical protein
MTGGGIEAGTKEVDASIERLFHYAAYADKFGGVVQETPFYGLTVSINEPTGVIGMVCPNEVPLLGLVSLVAPAVVRGNCVVAVPSEKHPLAATDLYQVLDTSDLPGGVINLVTGHAPTLATTLAEHQDVDAMWFHLEDGASCAACGSFVCRARVAPPRPTRVAHTPSRSLSRSFPLARCSTPTQIPRRALKASASRGGRDRTILSVFRQTT